jgi:hypothetical protein
MAWERRGGQAYYYRSVRDGGRVKKEYLGAGEFAEALARSDEAIRRARQMERERGRAEAERLRELAAPVLRLDEAADELLRAEELVAAGFHRHKGVWRRGRNA